MTEMRVLTLLQAQEQVAARVAELYMNMDAEVDEPDPDPEVQARDEVLERVCQSLAYMERSLAEVQAAKAMAVSETIKAKGEMLRIDREFRLAKDQSEDLRRKVEAQRLKKQQAVEQSQALRAELASLRGARREVARQMEAVDGAQGSSEEAQVPR